MRSVALNRFPIENLLSDSNSQPVWRPVDQNIKHRFAVHTWLRLRSSSIVWSIA